MQNKVWIKEGFGGITTSKEELYKIKSVVWIKEGFGCVKSLSNLDKGRTWLYHNIHVHVYGGVVQNIFLKEFRVN